MTQATLPQAIIPIGWANIAGLRTPVTVDIEWMRLFNDLLNRSGGTSGDDSFSNYINLLSEPSNNSQASKENAQAIDSLNLEIDYLKNNVTALKQQLNELYNAFEAMPKDDFRQRIEQIEGRLL